MNRRVEHRYLLNFAASPIGGGFKRLYEYARWFHEHGGAWFIVHPLSAHLAQEFPDNEYFVVTQSRAERIFRECGYLPGITAQIGQPDCYYSYGIPIPFRCGKVDWFHLSNVLPLGLRGIPTPLPLRLKFLLLGWKIRRHLGRAHVVSAESRNSLRLMGVTEGGRYAVSVNGSDDELRHLATGQAERKENVATVVGTYWYKALDDSCRVFDMLRAVDPGLTLTVIGDASPAARAHGMFVPDHMRSRADITVAGAQPRPEVVRRLRTSRYYISTTRVENSYNAASEGIFFADASYISDIGPHQELLAGLPAERVHAPGMARPVLHVRRDQMSGGHLKTWDAVITDMIAKISATLDGR